VEAELLGNLDREAKRATQRLLTHVAVGAGGVVEMAHRHHQHMGGSLRVLVVKGYGVDAASDFFRGNLAGHDAAEDAITHGSSSVVDWPRRTLQRAPRFRSGAHRAPGE